MPLAFTYEGTKYPTGSLKVREVEAIEAQLGVRYVELRPLASMSHKLAIMAAFLLRDHSEEEVAQIIADIDVDTVESMFTIEDDDLPDVYAGGLPDPKADGSATAG